MSETDTPPTYPALRNLEKRQQSCAEALRGGFERDKDLFDWSLELIAVSFGYFSNDFLSAFQSDPTIRLSLLTTEESTINVGGQTRMSQYDRRRLRHNIEEMRLTPVFQQAYKDLRANANEYVDPEARVSPSTVDEKEEDELPIALRPSLQELHDRQKEVLDELLTGFQKPVEILDWSRKLNAASHGEVPRNLINGLTTREKSMRGYLLGTEGAELSEMMRKKFASQCILPAFNNGIRTITGAAGERSTVEEETGGDLAQELGA